MDITTMKEAAGVKGVVNERTLALHVASPNEEFSDIRLRARKALAKAAKDGHLRVFRKAEFVPGMGMQPTEYEVTK